MNSNLIRRAAFAVAALLVSRISAGTPALAGTVPEAPVHAAPRPAPPCTAPPLPAPVGTEFAVLGGVGRFGCFESQSGGTYVFKNGRIAAIPFYGTNATYAMVIDAGDPQRIMHMYVNGSSYSLDTWLVRLTVDGALINQVTYHAGDGDIGNTYASDVLVHPGEGRHGAFQVAMEGCQTHATSASTCMGWSRAVFMLQL